VIVIAKVKSVTSGGGNKEYALGDVSEIWKGEKVKEVEFLATPSTDVCDESQAHVGETVVLFLEKSEKSRSYAIVHSGQVGSRCARSKGNYTLRSMGSGVSFQRMCQS
jgi:hypothetical protein